MSLISTSPASEGSNAAATRQLVIVLVCALAARLAYLYVKPAGALSDDVGTWQSAVADVLAGRDPYASGAFNWLPVTPVLLAELSQLTKLVSLPFPALLSGVLMALEAGIIVASFNLMRRFVTPQAARDILLVAVALNPAAIFQATQHGNFHLLLVLCVLLGLQALLRFEQGDEASDWLVCCACFGLGIMTKVVPLVLTPLLAAGAALMSWRERFVGAALLVMPTVLALGIASFFWPNVLADHVLKYTSVPGFYGITGLMQIAGAAEWWSWHRVAFSGGLLLAMSMTAVVSWTRGWRDERQLSLAAAMFMLAVPVLGPGHAPQYIYWYLPLLAVAYAAFDNAPWRRVLVIAWAVAALTQIFEYAFFRSHGAFMLHAFPRSAAAYYIGLELGDPRGQTLVRLPLFVAHLAVLVQGVRLLLANERKQAPAKTNEQQAYPLQEAV